MARLSTRPTAAGTVRSRAVLFTRSRRWKMKIRFVSRDEIDVAKRYTSHTVRFAVVLVVMLKSITVTIVHTPLLASLAVFLQGAAERVRWVV